MRELRHMIRDLEHNLPVEVKSRNCFVGVKLIKDETGNVIKKVIYDIKHGKLGVSAAEAADAVVSFDTAMNDLKLGSIDGIAIWLSEDLGFTIIDLDCHKDEDKQLFEALKRDILRAFPKTYAEVSWSTKGLHIILQGLMPADRKNSRIGGVIEVYSLNKPILLTGDMISESNNLMEGGGALESLCKQFLPLKTENEEEDKDTIPAGEQIASDEEVLEVALRDKKFRLLWEGKWEDLGSYPSHSEADCGFCRKLSYYCNNNYTQMDRLFRKSGMYRTDKERREAYIADKIQNAIKLCKAVCDWKMIREKQELEKKREEERQEILREQQEELKLHKEVVTAVKEYGIQRVQMKTIAYTVDKNGKRIKDEPDDKIHENCFESNKLFKYYDSLRATGIANNALLSEAEAAVPLWKLPKSEIGDAYRFSHYVSDNVLYHPLQETWYGWDERIWRVLSKEKVRGLQVDGINTLYSNFVVKCAEALSETEDFERKEALEAEAIYIYEYIQSSTTVTRVNNAITLAQPMKNGGYAELSKLRNVLTLQNGVFNFDTLSLEPFNKEYYQLVQSPIVYDPKADCPLWLGTLARFIPSETGREYFQKVCGYICSGETGERAIFLLVGAGGNGKSTILNVLSYILGSLAGPIKVSTLMDKGTFSSGISPELVALRDLRLGIVSENNKETKFDEGLLKSLSGSTPITCRGLYREPITFMPTIKLVFDTNYQPNFGTATIGLWDRIKLIPTTGRIEDSSKEKIKDFYKVIIEKEASGVFNWIVEGYRKYKEEGLILTAELLDAVQEYKDESNSLSPFMHSCIVFKQNGKVSSAELFGAYKAWCEDNGRKNYIMKPGTFTKELKRYFAGNSNVATQELRAGYTGFSGIEPSSLGYLYCRKATMHSFEWEKEKRIYLQNLLQPTPQFVGMLIDDEGKRFVTHDIDKATHRFNGVPYTEDEKVKIKAQREKQLQEQNS